jgi:hypothetical protein
MGFQLLDFFVAGRRFDHIDRLLIAGSVNVVLLQSSTPHMIGMHPKTSFSFQYTCLVHFLLNKHMLRFDGSHERINGVTYLWK